MVERIRAYRRAATPLGLLYSGAYIPVAAERHPTAFGHP
jgi:hypothetical protein